MRLHRNNPPVGGYKPSDKLLSTVLSPNRPKLYATERGSLELKSVLAYKKNAPAPGQYSTLSQFETSGKIVYKGALKGQKFLPIAKNK